MAELSACGYVSHKEFEKLDIRVVTIKAAKQHPTRQEYILSLDLGVEGKDFESVVDLGKSYKLDKLIGKQCLAVINIVPELSGEIESTAMLLAAADAKGRITLLKPDKKMVPGRPILGLMNSTCTKME